LLFEGGLSFPPFGFTTTTGGSFGGRLLSLLFFCANALAETMPIIAIANNIRLKFVIICGLHMLLKPGAWEERKESRH
jgi:hypothetical protein